MVGALSTKGENGWYSRTCPNGEDALTYEVPYARELRENGVETMPQVLNYICQKFGNKKVLGTRKLLRRQAITSPSGRVFEKLELGEYEWLTYLQVQKTVSNIGRGLRELGFKFGDRVAVFAETRAEWLMSAMGALQERVSVCTVYTNLSDDGIIHALNETEVSLVFTSYDLFQRIIKLLQSCPGIKSIAVMEDQLSEVDVSKVPNNVEVFMLKTLAETGENSTCAVEPFQKPDDTAIIMYTSGSTGVPKGVEISQSNMVHTVSSCVFQGTADASSRYLAFLPLAHIMEMIVQISMLSCGALVYYSSTTTFTTSSPRIAKGTEGDAKLAKPTHMAVVPLMLDKVIKSVTQKVEQQGWLKSFIFEKLLQNKFWVNYIPITSSLVDIIIFKKVKAELGGCLTNLIVGGAPISAQTHETFKAMFDCKLQVGYGCTETTASVTLMDKDTEGLGHVGPPNFGVLVKLVDWEEGGYRITDKPNPRGEIVVAGTCVTKGYFKRPEENEKAFYDDNGLHAFRTGDIGEIDQRGCLKIVDRLKDLVKLKHGEYVSLGSIEATVTTSPLVDNACVFADSLRNSTVMVIVPTPNALLALAKTQDSVVLPSVDSMSHLYTSPELNAAVLHQIQSYCKQCGLGKWELPAAVHLTSDSWDVESGLVTAALKLRRKQIRDRYSDQVKSMYQTLPCA